MEENLGFRQVSLQIRKLIKDIPHQVATVIGQVVVYLFEVGVKQAQPSALPVSESRAITQQCSPRS